MYCTSATFCCQFCLSDWKGVGRAGSGSEDFEGAEEGVKSGGGGERGAAAGKLSELLGRHGKVSPSVA